MSDDQSQEKIKCPKPPCEGVVTEGKCDSCGALLSGVADIAAKAAVFDSVRALLKGDSVEGPVVPSKEQLSTAAQQLQNVVPYNFEAWRLHADLLLNALKQLESRQFLPDPEFTLLSVALREDDLRDAAETALRQCARYADSEEKLIATIDEANQVRRVTWF